MAAMTLALIIIVGMFAIGIFAIYLVLKFIGNLSRDNNADGDVESEKPRYR